MNEVDPNINRHFENRVQARAENRFENLWRQLETSLAGQHYPGAALYVVATPIGNLADITARALYVLDLCDAIAAEDTRHSGQLLSHYGISKPLIACHQHNEHEAAQRVISALQAGQRVAFISDAGTPGISDPGAKLVSDVRAAGFSVVPIPGVSALTCALSVAGHLATPFYFVGFLPTQSQVRHRLLTELAQQSAAVVLYEAPHRVLATLKELSETFGAARRVLVARELTKRFEELLTDELGRVYEALKNQMETPKGEFVLVLGAAETPAPQTLALDDVLQPLLKELPTKQAVQLACAITGAARNAVYERALQLKA